MRIWPRFVSRWGWLPLLVLAGCAGDPGGSASGSAAGGWVWPQGNCTQRLSLHAGGGFSLEAEVGLGGAHYRDGISGGYTWEPGAENSLAAFSPSRPVLPSELLYCTQWVSRAEAGPEAEALASAIGIDPALLVFHTEVSATLGKISLGTDPDRLERVAIYQEGGSGYRVDALPATFFQAHGDDAGLSLESLSGYPVVRVPGRFYRGSFPGAPLGEPLATFYLNVAAAVDITLSNAGEPELPVCRLLVYESLTHSGVPETIIPPGGQDSITFSANPADPETSLVAYPGATGEVSETSYLMPAKLVSPADGGCAANLRARPAVVGWLESLVDGGASPTFAAAGLGPQTRMVETEAGRLRLVPLPPNLVRGWAAASARLVSLPPLAADEEGLPPPFDGLALAGAEAGTVELALHADQQGPYLNVFPSADAEVGMGPFRPYQPPTPAQELAFPGEVSGSFAPGETQHHFSLSLESETRVALLSTGAEMDGVLYDADGGFWGGNARGAPDGAGLRLVATLPAGAYTLTLTRLAEGAGYTLSASGAATPFPDDALQACVLDTPGNAAVTRLECPGRGVATLEGVETLGSLLRISVPGNQIEDLGPLQALPLLRELALDENPVTDLTPLAGLTRLGRLSLAGCPIGEEQLPLLAGMAGTLTHLDLTGVAGLTMEQVETLKTTLVNTTVITPDGTILE